MLITQLVSWLIVFQAELSPRRYSLAPRSLEVGEEGDDTQHYTVTTEMTLVLIWAVMKAISIFH